MSAVGSAQHAANQAEDASNQASGSKSAMGEAALALAAAAEAVAGGDGTGGKLRDRAQMLAHDQGEWIAHALELKSDIDEWIAVLGH